MKEKIKKFIENLKELGILLLSSLPLILVIVYIIVWVYVHIKFGEMPITEVPSWAIPFFTGSN